MKAIIFTLLFGLSLSLHSQDIEALYDQLNQSVVTILVKEKQLVGNTESDVRLVTSEGLGSGVYVNKEGIILTASHVVHNAESIMVLFPNGEKAPAKVQSTSVNADLAVIKTLYKPSDKIPVVQLGVSDNVQIGEKVMVIGAPYGLEHSLSVGYISGRHSQKSMVTGMTKVEFLQTDAAINHGNSGGPMFNMKGEVVGIVSHILSESGGFQGLGFASSIDLAKDLLNGTSGSWFGVDAVMLSEKMAKVLNIPTGGGLLCQRVVRSSPAGAAGVKGGSVLAKISGKEMILGGDVIYNINGIDLNNEASLEKAAINLDSIKKGDKIVLKILREGKEVEIELLKP